jgi:hypothetical protein
MGKSFGLQKAAIIAVMRDSLTLDRRSLSSISVIRCCFYIEGAGNVVNICAKSSLTGFSLWWREIAVV